MNKKGVTLIELIVVMVIIGIGAVLLAPNIGTWVPNYRLRSATRDITSTLRSASMKAVSTNLEYRVYFNAARQYWTERGNQSSGSTNWSTDPNSAATEGAINTLPTGVTKSFNGFIQFNTNSTCSAATINLTNSKGKQYTITLVTSTGKVNVSS